MVGASGGADQPFEGAGGPSSGMWSESGSARAVIGAAIAASTDRLDVELPRARLGHDPEGVHQARVATRRLRSDLRTFGPLLDEEWRDRTRAELRWLGDALGAVRDLDVLTMRFEAAFDVVGVSPDGAAAIRSTLGNEGRAARQAMVRVIDDPRTSALLVELHRRAADPPTTPSALGRAERRLVPLVRRPWRKLVRAIKVLDDDASVAELHRVRLLAKRARYAAEAVEPVFGRDARRFAAALAKVQDRLGEMNDAAVSATWLRRRADVLGPTGAFAAGELAHHFHGAADARRHGWERAYKRARRRSTWLS